MPPTLGAGRNKPRGLSVCGSRQSMAPPDLAMFIGNCRVSDALSVLGDMRVCMYWDTVGPPSNSPDAAASAS